MKRCLVALAVVLSVVTVGAQTPIINPGESLAFDYDDTLYADYAVVRFEVRWDSSQTWDVLNATPFKDAVTQPNSTSYAFSPPFQSGSHTVYVRACNVQVGCGESSDPFAFAFAVASAPPKAFGNFRVVKK